MVVETAARVARGDMFAGLTAIGSLRHEGLLNEALPGADLILEPLGRNSGPAVAAACLSVAQDQLLLVLPADHHIQRLDAFHAAIETGRPAAEADRLVTFGIEPDHAATGYGYIRMGAGRADTGVRPVDAFEEKPDRERAEAYLVSGDYLWNAGIFLFKAGAMLDALRTHAPDIPAAVQTALDAADRTGPIRRLHRPSFRLAPSLSIDHAVMEHADNVSVVPVDMGWSDLGDFRTLHEVQGRNLVSRGPVSMGKVERIYARSEGPKLVLHDVNDLAVVATKDAVLVTSLEDAAEIRSEVEAVKTGHMDLVDPVLRERACRWLHEHCVPLWLDKAWDGESEGFVEALDLTGEPLGALARRGRVLPRQTFAFARAAAFDGANADAAATLAMRGLERLDGRARAPGGGWAHGLGASGAPSDERRDLYDHAFVVLAGAEVFGALDEPRGLALAEEALSFIDDFFLDRENGGYRDFETGAGGKYANPHMHLLEACLRLYQVTGLQTHLDRASQIVELMETFIFDPRTDSMVETFASDWSCNRRPARRIVEPGHGYEWSALLSEFELESLRDIASWRRRLVSGADRLGRRNHSLFVDNAVAVDGSPIDEARRLWPQLEMLRAKLLQPETAEPGEVDRILAEILNVYIEAASVPGGWVDIFDASGTAAAKTIPASMLYHFLTAFGSLSRGAKEFA